MKNETDFFMLQNRFKEIKGFYSTENHQYIHVNTVDNFLSHSGNFLTKHHKQEIFTKLTEYLDAIESKQIDNTTASLELFNKYLRPLVNLFSDLRGFHMAVKPWIVLLWAIPIFILLYSLNASLYFYAALVVMIILLLARQAYFTSQNKTYGFLY